MIRFITSGIVVSIGCVACVGNPKPIIDTRGLDMERYQVDMAECEQIGKEVEIAKGTAKGAALGAAVGGAIGAISGDVGEGAGYGGVYGGLESGLDGDRERQWVFKECMEGRGYRVLNR